MTSTAPRAVLARLRRNRARAVELLKDYLRIPSVSAQGGHRGDVAACARWIERHCRSIGLETKSFRTAGAPIVVARTPRRGRAKKPHFVVYGHYDVQPPEPFELWESPPFDPTIRRGILYARGASDNKGQHLAHLNAVEAYLETGSEIPCDLTFVIEGEEEVGSSNLKTFLRERRDLLGCDGIVVSDSGMPSLRHPALTYGLRGNVGLELTLRGPSHDVHSGTFGGAIENPAMVLCRMLAGLKGADGRIAVPGFYDDVVPLSRAERRRLRANPLSDRELRRLAGAPRLGGGEAGYTPTERSSARPTLEINGLTSGYQGEGGKTIVPAWARVKLTCRLVPDQEPAKIRARLIRALKRLCPPTVRMEVTAARSSGSLSYFLPPDGPLVRAALRSLRAAYGYPPVLVREGGSIPIVSDFKEVLGAETLLIGFGLPDDRIHAPNENLSLKAYHLGSVCGAWLWPELAAAR